MAAHPNSDHIVDAGRVEGPKDPVDDEIEEEFALAGRLGQPRELARKLQQHTDRTPELSGGDVDAAWDQEAAGDENVGGDNPTPDQEQVDELGLASGVVYEDAEPLRSTEKVERRDRRRWELDPASSEDYSERNRPTRPRRRPPRKR